MIKVFGGSDGAYPNSTLIQGTDGAMYGTTDEGGSANKGVVYKLGTDGSAFAVLWNFGASAVDGASPRGALMQGTDGALYGTTRDGGLYVYGTVFKLNPDGSHYSVLKSFSACGLMNETLQSMTG